MKSHSHFQSSLWASRRGPPLPAPINPPPGFRLQVGNDGHVGGWFYFTKVKGRYEGRLVKMFSQPGDPVIDVCAKCTGKQKNAPMLGLVIVKDMKRDGLKYEDGSILDPRDGTVYHAQMELTQTDRSYRCAVISAFRCSGRRRYGPGCRTMRWRRPTFQGVRFDNRLRVCAFALRLRSPDRPQG